MILPNIAFIGGGFTSQGIHNTIEAAVFGKPVVFGPVYDKYLEAVELIETGGAATVETILTLEESFNAILQNKEKQDKMGKAAKNFVAAKAGATHSKAAPTPKIIIFTRIFTGIFTGIFILI